METISVTLRGICWSTNPNPTFNDNYVEVGNGLGAFTTSMTNLAIGTTYYVRAFAVTVNGTIYGNQQSFTTEQIPNYTITLFSNPTSGGTATGGGSYEQGQSCMVSATPNLGYTFINWKENGNVVSTNANYTFTVTSDRTLVANFTLQSYTISVSANPSNGGSVSEGGSYNYGQSCTVHATANTGYIFNNWTINGSVVSTNANYTFTVTSNRNLVANFTYNGGGNAPIGAINGLFSVSATRQVWFSRGNLQYQASTNTWRFAENQWDYVGTQNPLYGNAGGTVSGSDNKNISQTYNGWIDLFGWGTSGWHDPNDSYNVYYQPWSTSDFTINLDYNYYGYGPSTNMTSPNLTNSSANYDWGVYNPISNGSNQLNQWRTLTKDEWYYVINTRTTATGIRFAKARVNNVNGLVLLPDNWDTNYFSLNDTNQYDSSFDCNIISTSSWSILEQQGAVFLPAAGGRWGTSVYDIEDYGIYYSTSFASEASAYSMRFSNTTLGPYDNSWPITPRHKGESVRLIRDVQ